MSDNVKVSRTMTGRVKSAKMNKTISVEVERLVAHPVYGKYIRRSSTILAHDPNQESREGDVVVVSACKPISKRKVWTLQEIVDRAR